MTSPGPLIVQSDHTLLLEVEHPQYAECRDFLVLFAELVKSPEFIHTYKVTPLSLWNAAALELSLEEISSGLEAFAKYPLPVNVLADIRDWHGSYGKLILRQDSPERLRLEVTQAHLLERLLNDKSLQPFWLDHYHIDHYKRVQYLNLNRSPVCRSRKSPALFSKDLLDTAHLH